MPFRNVVRPEELALLTNALNDHCARFGIPDGIERDGVAILVLSLFRGGMTGKEQLAEALAAPRRPKPKA